METTEIRISAREESGKSQGRFREEPVKSQGRAREGPCKPCKSHVRAREASGNSQLAREESGKGQVRAREELVSNSNSKTCSKFGCR